MNDFAANLLGWFRHSGRHDLPWQRPRTPYRVWVSEVMLQQTQVVTVIPFFERFTARFPDVPALAAAPLDEVLYYWTGLGYYSRARNLHAAARLVRDRHHGALPASMAELRELPGIGRSTAAAILALAHDQKAAILDGNVKRILSRYYNVHEWPEGAAAEKRLWRFAEELLPESDIAAYTQAIMDLGASVCTRRRPLCGVCPVAGDCGARQAGIQADLPAPRPRRSLPLRHTRMLLLEDERGRILLEQRPPTGVWGGLWSLPECDPDADLNTWIAERFSLVSRGYEFGRPIHHGFSHFRLEIEPVRVGVHTKPDRIRDAVNLYWYLPNGDNRRIGLPGPVRDLIENRFANREDDK